MELALQNTQSSLPIIKAYTPHSIQVNALTYTQSILIHQNVVPLGIQSFSEHDKIIELLFETHSKITEPTLYLLGTGQVQQFLPPIIQRRVRHLSLEIMSTPAACRTHNTLLQDQRNVMSILVLENMTI